MGEYIEIATNPLYIDRRTIEREVNAIQSEVDRLFEEMQELDGMWEGLAKQAFWTQFQKDYEILKEVCTDLERYICCMQYAETEYQKCENQIADLIQAIRI